MTLSCIAVTIPSLKAFSSDERSGFHILASPTASHHGAGSIQPTSWVPNHPVPSSCRGWWVLC